MFLFDVFKELQCEESRSSEGFVGFQSTSVNQLFAERWILPVEVIARAHDRCCLYVLDISREDLDSGNTKCSHGGFAQRWVMVF